jgi:two-component system response regulator
MRLDIVLLVEDNPDDVTQILRAFQRNNIGNQVVVVRDGAEALDYLFGAGTFEGRDTAVQPGLVLLDLKLPRISGQEVLRRLRADPRTSHLPVVVLTSSREERDMAKSYSLGANLYVRKPVRMTEFLHAARHVGLYWSLLESGLALLHRLSHATVPGALPARAAPPPAAAFWPMEVVVAGTGALFEWVRDLLTPEGHIVAHVRDARGALSLIRDAGLPDVLVVDGSLPDIGGAELVRALRRSPEGERVTAVQVTLDPERLRADLDDDAVRIVKPPMDGAWLSALMRDLAEERHRSLFPADGADPDEEPTH